MTTPSLLRKFPAIGLGSAYPGTNGEIIRSNPPIKFTHPKVSGIDPSGTVKSPPCWADPPISEEELDKLPKNPVLEKEGLLTTGVTERGLLGRWGGNHAADPIVSRFIRNENGDIMFDNQDFPMVQFVLIERTDNGNWAIPGGMVDKGEQISQTLIREFFEEAGCDISKTSIKPVELYSGPVFNDPRNTDHAWMETAVFLFHDSDGSSFGKIKLQSDGVETSKVDWLSYEEIKSGKRKIYADHEQYFDMAMEKIREQV